MAISDLLPRHAMESKSRRQTLVDRLDYDQKEEKTQDGEYITSYMCCPQSAADEFEMSKCLYEQNTGHSQPKGRDIIAYRILQSFKPGEISPEEANRIGNELAMAFTKGKHQFVVSTHTDKAHIHTHIEFSSMNLTCDGKCNNFKNSAFALREFNDRLCREDGMSVIEHPKGRGQRFAEKAAFDVLAGTPIPKVAQLLEEYTALLSEKKERYEEYKTAPKAMLDLGMAKQRSSCIQTAHMSVPAECRF